MSAATYAEALRVGLGKNALSDVEEVLTDIEHRLLPTDRDACRRMIDAYSRWGKGFHPAKLNIFDCFAYALAEERGLPLLFVGRDFSQTDIQSALVNPDPDFR